MKSKDKDTRIIIRNLTELAKSVVNMQAQLSQGKGPDPLETNLPPEFIKAWIHLFACLINWRPETMRVAVRHANKCCSAVNKAYHLLLQNIDGKLLTEFRAVLPSELLVFLAKGLLDGVTGEQETIIETYWSYYHQIVRIGSPLK